MSRSQNQAPRRAYDLESNILIVDDDSTLLKFFKIHLNKFFSRVVVVESGKAALESMKDRPTDLVLTDVRMPKIDGLELLAKIRKQHPDIPVLLISGEPMSEDQQKLVATADGFLTKPFSVDDLNQYIATGVDLRNALKQLVPHLKDVKKIRDAIKAGPKDLEKLVKKGSAPASKEIQTKIKDMIKKSS